MPNEGDIRFIPLSGPGAAAPPTGGAPTAPAAAAPKEGDVRFVPLSGAGAPKPGLLSRAVSALPSDPYQAAESKQEGWVPWLERRGLEVGLGGLGGIGGATLGAIGGPVGAFGGGVAGSTGGLTLADMINAKLHGSNVPLDWEHIKQALKANALGSVVGEGIGTFGGPLIKSALGIGGKEGLEAGIKEVGTAAETGTKTLAEGAQAATAKTAETMAAKTAKLAEQFRPEAAQELQQKALGRSMEDTIAAQTVAPTASGAPGEALVARRAEFGNLLQEAQAPRTAARPELRQIIHSPDLPPEFWTKIQGMTDPTDVMKEITATPQRFQQFASRITTDEGRSVMRREFADAVNLGKIKPDEMMAPALKKLGFGGVLAKPEAWMKAGSTIDNLPEMLAKSPPAFARYTAAVKEASIEASNAENKSIITLARQQMRGLPEATKQGIEASIKAAKTPEEAANAALKAFGVNVPAGQGPTLVQRSIMDFKPSDGRTVQMMKRMAMRRGIFTGAGMAAGGAAGGMPGLVAVGGAMTLRAGMRKAWLWSVQHSPEAAEEYFRALVNPGSPGMLKVLAKRAVDASAADATAQTYMGATGTGLEQPPQPAEAGGADLSDIPLIIDRTHSPGPMGKAIEREQATQISTDRGKQDPAHLDRLQELHGDVAARKTPNVHNDLNSGRLSAQEIRRLVDNKPDTLAGMFEGMDLQTAMQAFAKGTPEEKELALAPLVQKINDEGKNLQPLQRRALMAQLRQAMPGAEQDQPQQAPQPDQQQQPQGMS